MARKQPKLMTLEEQRRMENRSMDRGKKLLAGCLLGAAIVLLNWTALPGIGSLTAAAVALAAAVIFRLKQLPLKPFLRLFLTAVALLAGLYLLGRGVLEILLNLSLTQTVG